MGRLAAAAALALLLVGGGCGSDDSDDSAGSISPRPVEATDPLPKLQRGYAEYVSPVAGFALGRPPGWEASEEGTATLMLAPDRLVALTISADRTSQALGTDLERFAVDTFTELPGYEGRPEPSDPKRFRHPYDGFEVTGEGVATDSGVRQRIRVVALARKGVVVLTAVIAENSDEGARAEVAQAVEAVRTLRSRPL